jgi:hypothetical protein
VSVTRAPQNKTKQTPWGWLPEDQPALLLRSQYCQCSTVPVKGGPAGVRGVVGVFLLRLSAKKAQSSTVEQQVLSGIILYCLKLRINGTLFTIALMPKF